MNVSPTMLSIQYKYQRLRHFGFGILGSAILAVGSELSQGAIWLNDYKIGILNTTFDIGAPPRVPLDQ